MRILIVDNNLLKEDWGAAHFRTLAKEHPGVTFVTRRGPDFDIPKDCSLFDKVIVSGSIARANSQESWITELESRFKDWMNAGIPILGVCHGHQILGRTLTDIQNVGPSKTPEVGLTKIEVCAESPLFDGLGKSFYTYSYHFDEVYNLPPETTLIAKSKNCAIQGFQHNTKPFFGIQFHPEKPLEAVEGSYKRYNDKKHRPHFEVKSFSRKLFDPDIKKTIFGNFIKMEKK